jgi:hypothetical protein
MSNADPFADLLEWVSRQCEALRRSIAQQLRRLREQRHRQP